VDDLFGLPVKWNAFVKNPTPSYPVDGLSYEAFDPLTEKPVPGVFVAGWSREASSGLVGIARKDGENGAQAVMQFLHSRDSLPDPQLALASLSQRLQGITKPIITQAELKILEAVEQIEAQQNNLPEFKFASNEEMFAALKRKPVTT
jgi:hypothetical protein